MCEELSPLGHPEYRECIAERLQVPHLAGQRPVPWHGVGALREVLVLEQLEASGLHGIEALLDWHHVGDAVAELNGEADLAVLGVVVVVVVGHEPFIHAKDTAGLEDAEDFTVDAFELGSVDGGLDGVDGVEGVIRKGHLLERRQ